MEGTGVAAAESTVRAQVLSGRHLMQQTHLLALTPPYKGGDPIIRMVPARKQSQTR